MARKNYYVILGVPRSESQAGIRSAFRDMAKRFHPDRAGEGSADTFREIAEAYDVLSDPSRRRLHNAELRNEELVREAPEVLGRSPREPPFVQPASIFSRPESVSPSFEGMFDRLLRNFTGIGVPKGEQTEGLNLEVVLTPEEASRGTLLPVGIPVFETCPTCGGTRVDWLYPCVDCAAQGIIERQETIRVRIPPRVRGGTILDVPLRGLGVHNFYLRVHVVIER